MKIAAAAYPLDRFRDWTAYEAKITRWVEKAVALGADLLVFPEYAAMELAALAGTAAAADPLRAAAAVSARMEAADALMARLAAAHDVHILSGSGPARQGAAFVNRAGLFGPGGLIAHQDKLIPTPFERRDWVIVPGAPLRLFDTPLGRIGVLICYDCEFPLLGRALAEANAEILLVPSNTEALAGYWRVRIGAMARALEGQCIVVHSPTVGPARWCPVVDNNTGAAAIYGPPDLGFPPTGVIAEGALDQPGWVLAEVDLAAVAEVRRAGAVANHADWPRQAASNNVEIRRPHA